ncbi:MAG: hypothetical protein ACO2Y1_08725, partial [Flavobacteriaceae bacterium]
SITYDIGALFNLTDQIANKYSNRLAYFESLGSDLQYNLGEEIITEIERYRALVEANLKHDKKAKLEEVLNRFVTASSNFKYLYSDYEFYTALEDVVEGYYLVGATEQAQNLGKLIAKEYSERIQLFQQFTAEGQLQLIDRIKGELMDYRYFLQRMAYYDSSSVFTTWQNQYEQDVALFTEVLTQEED